MTLARLALKEPIYPVADSTEIHDFGSERSGLLGLRNDQLIEERFMQRTRIAKPHFVRPEEPKVTLAPLPSIGNHYIILSTICIVALGVLVASIFSAFAGAAAGSMSATLGAVSAAFVGILVAGASLSLMRELKKKNR